MNSRRRLSLAFGLLLLASCSSQSKPPPGQACVMNSECNTPLVCTFGRCHAACAEARDCPAGALCVKGGTGAVCQLETESHCTYRSQCQAPLTCALDRQCRSECLADVDCPTKTQKCVLPEGVCAEPGEIDPATNHLRNAQPTPVPDDTDGGAARDAAAAGSDAALDRGTDAPKEIPAGTCTDLMPNGAETDTDCGGGTCPACALNKGCKSAADCVSNVCAGGKCLECMPGATKCVGAKQATCMGGLWVTATQDCASGCDTTTNACRVCPASTCKSVRVIFHGATSTKSDVQLAVDDGKTTRTSSDTDPAIGQMNVLYGNFTDDKKQYTTDNTACGLPDYGARTNVYYLAPLAPLVVSSALYGGMTDFADDRYCQSCPNFGCDNYISTPKRIDGIELGANSGDLTCKVCFYRAGGPSDAALIRCLSPNMSLTGADLAADKAPVVLQLDDGKRCGSY